MPKIQNWSLEGENLDLQRYHRHVEILWRHDDKPVEVVIMREDSEIMHKTKAKEYGVVVARVNGRSFEALEHRKFSNKQKAKDWARDWMEDHPMEQKNSSSTTYNRQY